VKYAFHDAVSVRTMPLIWMISMIVVQYDWNGRPRTLVFEPTVLDGNEPADVLALLGLSPGSDRRVVTHPPYPGWPRSHPVRGFDSYAGSLVRSYARRPGRPDSSDMGH